MGTLYIDRKELHIKLDGNALAFYTGGKREGIVPINPLKRVIMVGNISLETPVLHRLCDEGISVIFLSGKRLRFKGILHGSLHNNGILRLKQYEKSLSDFCREVSLDIVKRKIKEQKEFLLDIREKRPDLRYPATRPSKILEDILKKINLQNPDMETLRGLEGGASTTYFQAYTKLFPESLRFKKKKTKTT